MESYEFPEVYVEGIESGYYIVLDNGEYRFSKKPSGRFFGHIVYEDIVDKALDLINAVFRRAVIVIPRFRGKGDLDALLIEKNTKACLIEVKSIQPYILVREGDEIDLNDKIAYMVTGKGEVRVYKSPCKGLVVLVVNFPWEKPERYLLVVVSKDGVRRIKIKRD